MRGKHGKKRVLQSTNSTISSF